MKTRFKLAAMAASLLGINLAKADVVMVQETSSVVGKQRTTLSIKGSRVRTDVAEESSVIINTETGDMTTLMHEAKMMMTMNMKDLAALGLPTENKDEKAAPAQKLEKTGESEKVGSYTCDIYTMDTMGVTSKMWIARDYPGYEKLKKELSTLAKMASKGAEVPEMPGMAVKTETVAGGQTFTTTLISLKETKVDDAVFEIPAGYKAP